MQYHRSRPWRPRGPGFANRSGSRRRGPVVEMAIDDGLQTDAVQGLVAEQAPEANPTSAGELTPTRPRLMFLALGHHEPVRTRLAAISPAPTASLGLSQMPGRNSGKCRTA